jgi:hypothetical protein
MVAQRRMAQIVQLALNENRSQQSSSGMMYRNRGEHQSFSGQRRVGGGGGQRDNRGRRRFDEDDDGDKDGDDGKDKK